MAEYNPDDLIGRTFLLPKNEQGERLRATMKRKDKINFNLDVGQGRAEAIRLVSKFWTILTIRNKRRTCTSLGPSQAIKDLSHPKMRITKAAKYNIMVEWETGEITEEPLSLIAADYPVTSAEYAKKHDLLHLDGWKRLKYIAKNQKQLTRAINQSKIRQVRR